jgi:hypothetical protein
MPGHLSNVPAIIRQSINATLLQGSSCRTPDPLISLIASEKPEKSYLLCYRRGKGRKKPS